MDKKDICSIKARFLWTDFWILNRLYSTWIIFKDFYMICRPVVTVIHDDISTSIKEELKGFINWITMTRKSGKDLRPMYGTTEQLFRPY